MAYYENYIYPIGIAIMFYLFCDQLSDVLYKSNGFNERIKNTMIMFIVAGVIGLALAQTIFKTNSSLKNPNIKLGIEIGSVFLIIYSILRNWYSVTTDIKLIIIGIIFGIIIWCSYKSKALNNQNEHEKERKKEKSNKKSAEYNKYDKYVDDDDITEDDKDN